MFYLCPGSVRQLEKVIERLLIVADVQPIRVEDLPGDIRGSTEPSSTIEVPNEGMPLEDLEKILISQALAKTGATRAAPLSF